MDTIFSPVLNEYSAVKNINIINSICEGNFEITKKLLSEHSHISTIRDRSGRNIWGIFIHEHINMFKKSREQFLDFFNYLLKIDLDINDKQEFLKRAPILIAAAGDKEAWELVFFMLSKGATFNTSDMLQSDIWYYLNYNNYLTHEQKKFYGEKLRDYIISQSAYPLYLNHA